MNRTWGGRFSGTLEGAMLRLSASVEVDSALAEDDIRGSMAHARALGRAGLLTTPELEQMLKGLEQVLAEVESGAMVWKNELEDVHMNVEARLIELIGPLGGKLHTGRSRNDQVATDLRLWARRAAADIMAGIDHLCRVLLDRADEHVTTLLPGYTHLQRAQPMRLAHHFLAWFERLRRDRGRVGDAARRMNELPLGAGAIAGTTFDIDRHALAKELDFDRPMANSIDATASRDFLTELAAALALTAVHLSRIGEEIVLWSSQEFRFVELSDGFATGSSMMPQKKNPDVAELVRGKSARVIGDVVALLTLEKGLPLGYNRDLQEDKAPIFDAVATVAVALDALSGALATATFRVDRMRSALSEGHLTATEVADHLAARGVPFREAHEITGRLVREAMARGVPLREVPIPVMRGFHPLLDESVLPLLDPEIAIERRKTFGAPSLAQVKQALATARRALGTAD
ncbi:MAG TPA: argininosuccinate lyase [Polyangiaceae bacterium]|jgi:argininosuccinate lyase|nr:argininosuccinate lyase [Polyangiaceae bacterium]